MRFSLLVFAAALAAFAVALCGAASLEKREHESRRMLSLAGVDEALVSSASAYLEAEMHAAHLLSEFVACTAGCGTMTCIDTCANAGDPSTTLPSTAASTSANNNNNAADHGQRITVVNNVNTLNMGHHASQLSTSTTPGTTTTTTPGTSTSTTTTPTTPTNPTNPTNPVTPQPQTMPKLKTDIHFINGYDRWRVGDYDEDANKFGTALREFTSALQQAGRSLANEGLTLALAGFASYLGVNNPNRILSERRAKAVACYIRDYLIRQNIADFEFRMGYFGSTQSLQGGNAEQQKQDRRVDIYFPENAELNVADLQRFIWRAGKFAQNAGTDGGMNHYCSVVNWRANTFSNAWYQ